MASKRRGGFRAPELRGTLGTLLRTTTGVVRDALERGAREGRARLDGARASRRRHDALVDLGELVLDLIRRGEIDLAELPEARDLVRELDDLDDDTATADPAALTAAEPDLPRPSTRRRFDDRGRRDDRDARDDRHNDGTVSSGATARPDRSDRADRSERHTIPDRPRSGDTSSSRASTRPLKGALRATFDDASHPDHRTRVERWDATRTDRIGRPGRPEQPGPGPGDRERGRSERPDERERTERTSRGTPTERERERTERRPAADERDPADRTDHRDPTDHDDRPDHHHPDSPDRPTRSPLPRDPTRKGGISFDDEDLADYMHPDDVPAKPSSKPLPPDPDDHDA